MKIGHRNKSACCKWNPLQSSRSMTYPRKGCLLRFWSNSTSHGCAQKLGNNLWYHPELTATKVCSHKGCKSNKILESLVKTCIDRTSFNFELKDFLSNLLLKIIIYWFTDKPFMTQSWRSVLIFKFLVLNSRRKSGNITFAQMRSHFAPPTPVLYSGVTHPFRDMYVHKIPQTPPQNTPPLFLAWTR